MLYWHCKMYTVTFTKHVTHSMIFFTTHDIINITHDCSVQINTHTILFTFLFTLVKISHSTTNITLQ